MSTNVGNICNVCKDSVDNTIKKKNCKTMLTTYNDRYISFIMLDKLYNSSAVRQYMHNIKDEYIHKCGMPPFGSYMRMELPSIYE